MARRLSREEPLETSFQIVVTQTEKLRPRKSLRPSRKRCAPACTSLLHKPLNHKYGCVGARNQLAWLVQYLVVFQSLLGKILKQRRCCSVKYSRIQPVLSLLIRAKRLSPSQTRDSYTSPGHIALLTEVDSSSVREEPSDDDDATAESWLVAGSPPVRNSRNHLAKDKVEKENASPNADSKPIWQPPAGGVSEIQPEPEIVPDIEDGEDSVSDHYEQLHTGMLPALSAIPGCGTVSSQRQSCATTRPKVTMSCRAIKWACTGRNQRHPWAIESCYVD